MVTSGLRVALCQINTTVGAFQSNVDKILSFVDEAGDREAEIAIFPEMCLSGYPPLDLLDRPELLENNQNALNDLLQKLSTRKKAPKTLVLGSIQANLLSTGKFLHNSALVIENGKIVHQHAKCLLPTYDVFDEARYFEPGKTTGIWEGQWGKVGFSICEDAWFGDLHRGRNLYQNDPALNLRGSDWSINISASPFEMNKRARRKELLSEFVRRIQSPLFYVNQVGANDEILFDGGSLIFSSSGGVLFELPSFKECLAIVEFHPQNGGQVSPISILSNESGEWKTLETTKNSTEKDDEFELLFQGLVVGIRDYYQKTGFKCAVIGLSGGIDSAVIACLASKALGPSNVLGVAMPSQYSSTHSLADAESLAKNLGIHFQVLPIKAPFTAVMRELESALSGTKPDATEENIQARLRAVLLMALANKRSALVLTTGNKSEMSVGYCTTYGDMAGALAPIGDVYKTRVYELARYINRKFEWIPSSTLTKPPSAELRPDQKDEDSLGSYAQLDRMLELHQEGMMSSQELIQAGFDPNYVKKILGLVRNSEFKRRQAAPVLKVTSKAFGLGRRMPVAKSL